MQNVDQDTSILGSAPLAAKLAQSTSAPSQSLLASRTSAPDCHVYASGNPVISTTPVLRLSSASLREPRTSSVLGEVAPTVDSVLDSNPVHGRKAAYNDVAAARQNDTEAQLKGDISAYDHDNSMRPKSALLRRLSSLNLRSRLPSAKQEVGTDVACAGAYRTTRNADGQASRASVEPCAAVMSSALPCVDVEPERRQLLRKFSPRNDTAPLQPKNVAVGPRRLPASDAFDSTVVAEYAATLPQPISPDSRTPAIATATSAPDRPSTPLRRLSRLISGSLKVSGSLVAPAALPDQSDPDGAGAGKRRPSSAGIRDLFSRPSSAKMKSDAGARAHQQPLPMEVWKPQPQQRQSGGERGEDDRVTEPGAGDIVVRQSGSALKRAANALVAALGR
ncbi:hypothetical protein Vretimale_3970 [Volvox reticuliferus]|uniref:Uncharacterized protein n=1 Tax=Volvox reticuliferus TaxID=1737510 RepID=A0A8J4DA18_9CHLO|nr:hypothetical protein Vretimale_3970 [Volvox reticuliferus]